MSRIKPVQKRIFTTGTEVTEKSFCFSGDARLQAGGYTEKQEYSVLKSLHVARGLKNTLPVIGVSDLGFEKQPHHEFSLRGSFRLSVDPPVCGGHLPIDEKMNLPLCDLSTCGEPNFEKNKFSPKTNQ